MSTCAKLHAIAWELPEHTFVFDRTRIPENGMYFLFEKGEKAHGGKRIVRVGTHTGESQLRSRLAQHFLVENKDRSIFRKNIGRALLHKSQDPFLADWELDLTPAAARKEHGERIDAIKYAEIEQAVTAYMCENLSFVVLPVSTKEERLYLESRIISTLSLCPVCGPSDQWLGNSSPKQKIRESGLWLVNELYKTSLSEADMDLLVRLRQTQLP